MRERIGWFEKAPLHGRCVMVARARPGPSRIAARLRARGALVLERPKISLGEASWSLMLEHALQQRHRYDAIVFGCSAGVEAASRMLRASDLGRSFEVKLPVIAVGRAAADALERNGISACLQVDRACREVIAGAGLAIAGKRLILVVSTQGRPSLKAALTAAGASVEEVPGYQPFYKYDANLFQSPELILLPSSSAARLLLGGDDGRTLAGVPMIAIGPITETVAKTLGATNVEQSDG